MGIDCSNCRCTNQDEEKILIIDQINVIKQDKRKDKLEIIEKSQSSYINFDINNAGYSNILNVNKLFL